MVDEEPSIQLPSAMGKVALRALNENGIHDIMQASKYTEKDLLVIHGVGPKAIKALRDRLEEINLHLRKN